MPPISQDKTVGPPIGGGAYSAGRSHVRTPPPMRVVTKGWWTLKERRESAENLERQDRGEHSKPAA